MRFTCAVQKQATSHTCSDNDQRWKQFKGTHAEKWQPNIKTALHIEALPPPKKTYNNDKSKTTTKNKTKKQKGKRKKPATLWKQWALPSSCWARKRRAAISAKVTPPRKNTSVSFCSPELDWEDEMELPETQNTRTHWSKHALFPWSYKRILLPVPVYTLTVSINTNTLPPISKHLLVSKHTL